MLIDKSIKTFFEENIKIDTKIINHPSLITSFYLNKKLNHLWIGDDQHHLSCFDLKSINESADLDILKKVKLDLFQDENIHSIYSNDTETLLTTSNNSNTTRLITLNSNEPSQHFEKRFKYKIVTVSLIQDSRTGQSIQLASGLSKIITAIDCYTNKEFRLFEGHLNNVVRLKTLQGCLFLSSSTDKTVKLWDIRIKDSIKTFQINENIGTSAPLISVDSTGNCLTLGSSTIKNVYSYDLMSGRLVSKDTVSGVVKGLEFSPSERVLLTSTPDNLLLANMTQIPVRFKAKPLYKIPSNCGVKFHPSISWTRMDRNIMLALNTTSKQLYSFLL